MLTAAFTPRMRAYERRVGRIDEMKLVVLAIDSLHLGVQTPSNHDTLKRTFSSKISRSGVVCTVVSSSDAMPCWIGCLAASVSPANTDERLGELYMCLNSQGLNGGLLDLLTGLTTQGQNQIASHDFFTVLLMDKSYRGYGRHVAGSQTLRLLIVLTFSLKVATALEMPLTSSSRPPMGGFPTSCLLIIGTAGRTSLATDMPHLSPYLAWFQLLQTSSLT